jgi:carbamoyl-phosphate synthase large subunit
LFNIQFIVDERDNVYIIEVNPRSSRTVPFLSKATGYSLADIATLVILDVSLSEQGIIEAYPEEKKRWYVKVPAFSFSKLRGMDSYLSPEMKSTGEAIGYDKKLHRAMYKALLASGITLQNYGTVVVTLADEDKEEALPLVKRFYNMGFNIEATIGTASFLKEHGIRTRVRRKLSEGSQDVLDAIRSGYVSYVINTRAILSGVHYEDGVAIRRCAVENGVTMLTALDTVRVLLDVLEEITIGISTIDT